MDARRSLLAVSLTGLFATAAPAAGEEASIAVRIYNLTHLPAPVVSAATEQAARVFRRAGIGVEWIACSGADPDRRCASDVVPLDLLVRLQDGTSAGGSGVCGVALVPAQLDTGHLITAVRAVHPAARRQVPRV